MNIKVRIKNKTFWLAFIPALLLIVQQVASLFGFTMNLTGLQEQLLDIVNTVFTLLAVIGIINDPTTAGLTDSKQALTYEAPKKE